MIDNVTTTTTTTTTNNNNNNNVGQDSSVCTATQYSVDGPGIESRWGRDFPHPVRLALGPPSTMGTGSLPRVKRLGRGVDHPSPSSAEVRERVEL